MQYRVNRGGFEHELNQHVKIVKRTCAFQGISNLEERKSKEIEIVADEVRSDPQCSGVIADELDAC